jgi:hypothetical protein
MVTRPADVQAIYDIGPDDAIDRYTVVLGDEWGANPGYHAMLGLSNAPEHPQGFSQFTEGLDGPHLGQPVAWGSLPTHIREHIAMRVTGIEIAWPLPNQSTRGRSPKYVA